MMLWLAGCFDLKNQGPLTFFYPLPPKYKEYLSLKSPYMLKIDPPKKELHSLLRNIID
jgi:hypothetical protein